MEANKTKIKHVNTPTIILGVFISAVIVLVLLNVFSTLKRSNFGVKFNLKNEIEIDKLIINKSLDIVYDIRPKYEDATLIDPSAYDPTVNRYIFDGIRLNLVVPHKFETFDAGNIQAVRRKYSRKLTKGKILLIEGNRAAIIDPKMVSIRNPVSVNRNSAIIFHESFNSYISHLVPRYKHNLQVEARTIGLTTGALPGVQKKHDAYHIQRIKGEDIKLHKVKTGVARHA